ncbi:MAG: HD domain-containing protein [Bacillota bacterium]
MSRVLSTLTSRLWTVVEERLSCCAHNLGHVHRVYRLALRLSQDEPGADLEILLPAAILHDVARALEDQDPTGSIDHAMAGAELAVAILRDQGYPEHKLPAVRHCIEAHRYRGRVRPSTIEAQILSDADKIDAVGAVGIARSFMLAGQYGEPMYSGAPLETYVQKNTESGLADGRIKDISQHAPDIEYRVKLRHITDRLYTGTAKTMAQARLAYMEGFFDLLRAEIQGDR